MGRVFDNFLKEHVVILLLGLNPKVIMEDIFEQIIRDEITSNGNRVKEK
jgi:hypothetical protein